MWMTLLPIALAVWLLAGALVLALCRSSARGDAAIEEHAREHALLEVPGLTVWDMPAEVGVRDLRPLARL